MISGLNGGDYFVIVFLCSVMATRKIVLAALDDMIKESKTNSKLKLIMIYMVGLMIGNIISMIIVFCNANSVFTYIMDILHGQQLSNQTVIGELIKSTCTLVLLWAVFLLGFKPILNKMNIIIGEK